MSDWKKARGTAALREENRIAIGFFLELKREGEMQRETRRRPRVAQQVLALDSTAFFPLKKIGAR